MLERAAPGPIQRALCQLVRPGERRRRVDGAVGVVLVKDDLEDGSHALGIDGGTLGDLVICVYHSLGLLFGERAGAPEYGGCGRGAGMGPGVTRGAGGGG